MSGKKSGLKLENLIVISTVWLVGGIKQARVHGTVCDQLSNETERIKRCLNPRTQLNK